MHISETAAQVVILGGRFFLCASDLAQLRVDILETADMVRYRFIGTGLLLCWLVFRSRDCDVLRGCLRADIPVEELSRVRSDRVQIVVAIKAF